MSSAKAEALLLEDRPIFFGRGIGAKDVTLGEAVLNTGMVEYNEPMTDPSCTGELLANSNSSAVAMGPLRWRAVDLQVQTLSTREEAEAAPLCAQG